MLPDLRASVLTYAAELSAQRVRPLLSEYTAAHTAMLRRAGVAWASVDAVADMHQRTGVTPRTQGLTPIEPTSDWLYEPAGTRRGWCLPVMDGPDVVDLVAWYPPAPQTWYRRTGAGLFLGSVAHPPVRVVRMPLEWALASPGVASDGISTVEYERTICVLDWQRPEELRMALGDGPFIAADKELGKRLDAALTPAKHHRISIRT